MCTSRSVGLEFKFHERFDPLGPTQAFVKGNYPVGVVERRDGIYFGTTQRKIKLFLLMAHSRNLSRYPSFSWLPEIFFTCSADNSVTQNLDDSSDGSNAATNILCWIFDNTKAKVMELIEKITKLVNELFQPPDDEKTAGGATNPFEEKLRTSFLLSIVVLLIVVVGRARTA